MIVYLTNISSMSVNPFNAEIVRINQKDQSFFSQFEIIINVLQLVLFATFFECLAYGSTDIINL